MGNFRIVRAVDCLRGGGVMAYPTEAVWGLGCDPFSEAAVMRLLALKKRRRDMGLIVIAASIEQLEPFLAGIPAPDRQLLEASWPGPQTWLVPNNGYAPTWVTGGRETLALRVTNHPVAAALCRAYGGGLISTSANPHGFRPALSLLKLNLYFYGQLDYVLPGPLGGLTSPTPIKNLKTGEMIRGS
ncbi:MAG: tRNA threonylcarbamoyladenosine biosynthesis protein RimN [Porticoccus sp.]|nr:MAG: tRNA threonylcarbamoyladenosine biosynthesis protein RimN [Porticoccus sp.]